MRRVLPMVISFLFRIEQLKDDDPREDAPHFSKCLVVFARVANPLVETTNFSGLVV